MVLHTTVQGKGEPVVFLHSGLQTGETDFVYHRTYFGENYRVIMADLRGHGKSVCEKLNRESYFEETVNDLIETFDDLKLQSVHLIGASLGAIIGLMAAKRHPSRIKSLVLSGIMPQEPADYEALQEKDREMQRNLLENEEAAAYFNEIHQADWKNILTFALESEWYPFHETGDVTNIQCPAIIIAGDQQKHEAEGALYYQQMNNNFHIAIIPFAAHLVHNEQPEIYSQIVERFIKGVTR